MKGTIMDTLDAIQGQLYSLVTRRGQLSPKHAMKSVDEAYRLGYKLALKAAKEAIGYHGDWLAKATFAEAVEMAARDDAEAIARNMRGMSSLMRDVLNRDCAVVEWRPSDFVCEVPPCCKFGPGGDYTTVWPRKAAKR